MMSGKACLSVSINYPSGSAANLGRLSLQGRFGTLRNGKALPLIKAASRKTGHLNIVSASRKTHHSLNIVA